MKNLTFTNSKGDSIAFDRQNFLFTALTGFGEVGADIQRQKAPYQDGSTLIDVVLDERPISFEVSILGRSEVDISEKRRLLSRIFNPKLGNGQLSYTVGKTTFFIEGISEHVPSYPPGNDNRGNRFQRAIVDLICPNPYWISGEIVEQLVVWEGGLTFPLRLPTHFARQSASKAKVLMNEGDAETPLRIVFNGPATAPILVENKTTGELIEVNQSLAVGERIEINTAFGQKRVEKVLADGTRFNAFHYIKRGSKFFQLIPGNNLLDYSTGEDYERAGVTITWHNRYLSV